MNIDSTGNAKESNQPDQSLKYQPIGSVAARLRVRLVEQLGQANFARLMLAFDEKNHSRLDLVVETMRTCDNASIFHLGVCWLAGKGYHEVTLAQMLSRQFEGSKSSRSPRLVRPEPHEPLTYLEVVHMLESIGQILLPRLLAEGYEMVLSSNDERLALYQLKKIHLAGEEADWLNDGGVIHAAGLGRSNVALLLSALGHQENLRMQELHRQGNG